MKKMTRIKRLLAIILAVIMAFACFEQSAYAVTPDDAPASPADRLTTLETVSALPGEEPVDEATPAEEVTGVRRADNISKRDEPADPDPEGTLSSAEVNEAEIVSEDRAARGRYSKDFLLEDMSRLAVTYPGAVHFEDENGWADIDNTLFLYGEEGREVWRNKANSVIMELPAVLTSENGPGITFKGDSLGFCFLGKANEDRTADPETGEDPETEAATEAVTESEKETESEAETETESEAITEAVSEAAAESEKETEPKAASEPKALAPGIDCITAAPRRDPKRPHIERHT